MPGLLLLASRGGRGGRGEQTRSLSPRPPYLRDLRVRCRCGGLVIGLRVGYRAASFDSDWDAYEHTVVGGPDASIAGPYARIVVGWAWRR
jgi:hypothetical protein